MEFNYFMPTRVLFGPGTLNELAKQELPGKKALIVISSGNSIKKYGYLKRLQTILDNRDITYVVYDKILPNPVLSHVMEGASIARTEHCDFVIGLGGGSSIDSAKSIALMAKNPGNYWDYVNGGSGKGLPVENGALPIVAITTTAGTGTEVDPYTVILKEDTFEKIGFGCACTFPTLSVVDPELMLSVPTLLTAYQGFDALFHATEGYISKAANPISDIYALKSIELITHNLTLCVKDGKNIKARTQVALASTFSGFVEATSRCTSEHSMEHALSANHPTLPHGAGLIMLSASYYTFFATKVPEKFMAMAKAMGVDLEALSPEERPMSFVTALLQLQKDCGVDQLKMSNYDIHKEDIKMLAENARHTMGKLFEVDPYTLSLEETISIMAKAYR